MSSPKKTLFVFRLLRPLVEDGRDALFVLGAAAVLFFITGACLIYQTFHKPLGDSAAYVTMGAFYQHNDISQNFLYLDWIYNSLRTYFHPWLLALLLGAAKTLSLPLPLVLWPFQTAIYLAASLYLATLLARHDKRLGQLTLLLFCSNAFLAPYLSIPLTDGPFCIGCIFWIAAAIDFHRRFQARSFSAAVPAALLLLDAGTMLVLRPAGTWLCLATFALFLWYLTSPFLWRRENLLATLAGGTAAVAVLCLPLAPEVYINVLDFKKITPLPTYDLGADQTRAGIFNLKYATHVERGGATLSVNYPNPWYTPATPIPATPLLWYARHPFRGAAMAAAKFVGAFDFDYLYPYVYHLRSHYRIWSGFASLTVLYLGMWGLLSYTFFRRREAKVAGDGFLGPRFLPLLYLACWASVSLAAMYELRFGLPLLALFLVFAAERALHLVDLPPRRRLAPFAAYGAGMVVLGAIACFVSAQNALLR